MLMKNADFTMQRIKTSNDRSRWRKTQIRNWEDFTKSDNAVKKRDERQISYGDDYHNLCNSEAYMYRLDQWIVCHGYKNY